MCGAKNLAYSFVVTRHRSLPLIPLPKKSEPASEANFNPEGGACRIYCTYSIRRREIKEQIFPPYN